MRTKVKPKIYLVMQGEYSDRCVIGAFFSEEKAKKYADIKDKVDDSWGSAYVSEVNILDNVVDVKTPVNEYKHFTLFTNEDSDDEYEDYEAADVIYQQSDKESFYIEYEGCIEAFSRISYDHAKKVAREAYQISTQNKAAMRGDI